MSRFEFFTTTGIKLIAIQSSNMQTAINWFRTTYPLWDYGYVARA